MSESPPPQGLTHFLVLPASPVANFTASLRAITAATSLSFAPIKIDQGTVDASSVNVDASNVMLYNITAPSTSTISVLNLGTLTLTNGGNVSVRRAVIAVTRNFHALAVYELDSGIRRVTSSQLTNYQVVQLVFKVEGVYFKRLLTSGSVVNASLSLKTEVGRRVCALPPSPHTSQLLLAYNPRPPSHTHRHTFFCTTHLKTGVWMATTKSMW